MRYLYRLLTIFNTKLFISANFLILFVRLKLYVNLFGLTQKLNF